jgi:hypothetical protein
VPEPIAPCEVRVSRTEHGPTGHETQGRTTPTAFPVWVARGTRRRAGHMPEHMRAVPSARVGDAHLREHTTLHENGNCESCSGSSSSSCSRSVLRSIRSSVVARGSGALRVALLNPQRPRWHEGWDPCAAICHRHSPAYAHATTGRRMRMMVLAYLVAAYGCARQPRSGLSPPGCAEVNNG